MRLSQEAARLLDTNTPKAHEVGSYWQLRCQKHEATVYAQNCAGARLTIVRTARSQTIARGSGYLIDAMGTLFRRTNTYQIFNLDQHKDGNQLSHF